MLYGICNYLILVFKIILKTNYKFFQNKQILRKELICPQFRKKCNFVKDNQLLFPNNFDFHL